MKIIIGIDPGLQRTGWGIIKSSGNSLSYIDCGVIKSDAAENLAKRIAALHEGISKVIARHNPDEAAVEETFVNKNAMSSLKLGHARGAAILSVTLAGIPVHEYAALLVKKTVTGVGRAEKPQVQAMVSHILPTARNMTADSADALAVAICHASHMGMRKILEPSLREGLSKRI